MRSIVLTVIFYILLGSCLHEQGVSGAGAPIHESPPPRRIAKELTDRNNYKAAAAPNSDSSNNYAPYAYRRSRRGGDNNELISNRLLPEDVSGAGSGDVYDPFFFYPGNAGLGARSRRNSQVPQYLRAAPSRVAPANHPQPLPREREVAYLYERNANVENNDIYRTAPPSNHRLYNYRNPNTFLTKQQVTGVATRNTPTLARYYYPQSNAIDYRKPSYYDQGRGYYRGGNRNNNEYDSVRQQQAGGPEEAWSIQVGTQLKVHDDGRARNPEQFYVRDEQRNSNYNRRRPAYY